MEWVLGELGEGCEYAQYAFYKILIELVFKVKWLLLAVCCTKDNQIIMTIFFKYFHWFRGQDNLCPNAI